jgi:hypothetical protein
MGRIELTLNENNMAKNYFGFTVLRGLDHLYVKEKDMAILRKVSQELCEDKTLKGRIERDAIQVEMTHKDCPKNSDPIAIEILTGGCILISQQILVVLEELGFKEFKAVPVVLSHKATKRNLSFWLFKCTEQVNLPLQKEVICFQENGSIMVYFSKEAKEKIEALNPPCIKFVVPFNIDQF